MLSRNGGDLSVIFLLEVFLVFYLFEMLNEYVLGLGDMNV